MEWNNWALPSGTADADDRRFFGCIRLALLGSALRLALEGVSGAKGNKTTVGGRRISLRHLGIYLGHVLLGLSQGTIARLFHRDRSTVRYVCAHIEDFRDDRRFDKMLEAIEASVAAFICAFALRQGGRP